MSIWIPDRLLWVCLVLAVNLLSGCAQWEGWSPLLERTGEVRGRVEGVVGAAKGDRVPGAVAGREVLVFLESETPRASRMLAMSRFRVRRIELGAEGRSSEIQLVSTGQPIRFENRDAIHHELFTAGDEGALRFRLRGHSESETLKLTRSGIVRFFCALHPDEIHVIVVSEGREHAFVDATSHFRIPRVKPGRYRVRAVSASDWTSPRSVTIGAAETVEVTLRLGTDRED